MSEIVFYDPNKHHYPSRVDLDILYLQCSECLCQSLSMDNHRQYIVCICCFNTTTRIDEVQKRQQTVLIYLCKEHCKRETNRTENHNIRDDIVFDSEQNLKVEIQSAGMKANRTNGCRMQALSNLQKLLKIKGEPSETQMSVEDKNQYENPSNEDAQGEQTEEIDP